MDVVLVTCAALPGLASDDRVLLAALLDRGIAAEPVVWEDPHYPWGHAALCVVRSAWDYSYRRGRFIEWARGVADTSVLRNPFAVVEWNTHKRYLLDLSAAGVPVVPTALLPAGTAVRLDDVLRDRGWDDAVVKAAVAQTGRYLKRVSPGDAAGQQHLDRLLPHEDMLVQQFLPEVTASGEISIVFVDGQAAHAVRKRAAGGDFRVHHDFGGGVEPAIPSADELAAARQALDAAPGPLLYARVDLVRDRGGAPVVMELELVEPELFFVAHPESANRMAEAIAATLSNGRMETNR